MKQYISGRHFHVQRNNSVDIVKLLFEIHVNGDIPTWLVSDSRGNIYSVPQSELKEIN